MKIHGTKVGTGYTGIKIRVAEGAVLAVNREFFMCESAIKKKKLSQNRGGLFLLSIGYEETGISFLGWNRFCNLTMLVIPDNG